MLNQLKQLESKGCHFVVCGYKKYTQEDDNEKAKAAKAPNIGGEIRQKKGGKWEPKDPYNWKSYKPKAEVVWKAIQEDRLWGIVPASLSCVVGDIDGGDYQKLIAHIDKVGIKYKLVKSREDHHIWFKVSDGYSLEDDAFQSQWAAHGCHGDTRHNGGYVVIWDFPGLIKPWNGTIEANMAVIKNTLPSKNGAKANTPPATTAPIGPYYETGNEFVYKDELISALKANCRDKSDISENGKYLVVENPLDMSANMTCRLSVHLDTGAAHDFKSEKKYSPIEIARSLNVKVHRKKLSKPIKGTGIQAYDSITFETIHHAINELGYEFRYNLRGGVYEWKKNNSEWDTVIDELRPKIRRTLADTFKAVNGRDKSGKITSTKDFYVSQAKFDETLSAIMFDNQVDPFIEYLESLTPWDPETDDPKVNYLLKDEAGADNTMLTFWASRLLLLGVIQRSYEPGCALDEMVILVGPQGYGKSKMLLYMLPDEKFYSSSLHFDDPLKVQVEATLGKALVEVPEMVGSTKADMRRIKSFISKTQDEVRLAFARFTPSIKRRFIIVGTTNEEESLPNDPTGNRRFIPIKITKRMDLDKLKNMRDNLWREALFMYRNGLRANLPQALWKESATAAEEHRNKDEVEAIIQDANFANEYYSMQELKDECEILAKYSGKRIGAALRNLGWEYKWKRVAGVKVKRWFTPNQ